MPPAARIMDPVAHVAPPILTPGPGSTDVLIGFKPAWRGVPAAVAAALKLAKEISDKAIKVAEKVSPAAGETAKTAAALAMNTAITAAAGGADIHTCTTPLPTPPHGSGVVIDGSATVIIDNLQACREGDTILEALGPTNSIAMGEPTVLIGD